MGRAQLYYLYVNQNIFFIVVCIYCFTGGSCHDATAQQTDELVQAILLEFSEFPDSSKLITTDLNTNACDIPNIKVLCDYHGWCDVGATASTWGGADNVATCLGDNAKQATRRYYIFASPSARHYIRGFEVADTDAIPVHNLLRPRIRTAGPPPTKNVDSKSFSYSDMFDNSVLQCHSSHEHLTELPSDGTC
jgi:cytochrome c1